MRLLPHRRQQGRLRHSRISRSKEGTCEALYRTARIRQGCQLFGCSLRSGISPIHYHLSDELCAEMTVTLFPLPSLSPPTPLLKAKAAFSFAVHSYIQNVQLPPNQSSADSDVEFKRTQPIPTLVTQLLIGCRRRAVLYSWKDGEFQAVKVSYKILLSKGTN